MTIAILVPFCIDSIVFSENITSVITPLYSSSARSKRVPSGTTVHGYFFIYRKMSAREDSPGAAASDPPKFREAQPSDSEDSDSDSHSSESPESSSEPEDEGQPAKQRGMIGPVIPPELKNMSTGVCSFS